MNKVQNVIIILLILVFTISCKQTKLLLQYGTEDRLLIYSDSSYSEGKIIFKIEEYNFYFEESSFKSTMIENHDIEFEAFTYLKTFSQNYLQGDSLLIIESVSGIMINGNETKFPLSYDIRFIMDKLVKEGDFYLENKSETVNFIEYTYWTPQYQGAIYSKWIIDNKVVNKFIWGFVD